MPKQHSKHKDSTPLLLIKGKEWAGWIKKQPSSAQQWLEQSGCKGEAGQAFPLPAKGSGVDKIICIIADTPDIWSLAHLPASLPARHYHIENTLSAEDATQLTLGWKLASYSFSRYKKSTRTLATLTPPKNANLAQAEVMADAMCWARDMINTPANDMNPVALAAEATRWAKAAGGQVTVIKGDALLKENYPMIYTVGKASHVPPHLVDIRFPRKGAKKVTLVGKGVCFDSGGLDIKSTSNMKLMKKDMGGAASVLALAKILVELNVNIQLRVLLPIVENAVSGNAMRPLDIVKTRKGLTVEIGNTDAEGRLILCDALTEADGEKPDLLVDCATLTGAARVALGTDIPAFFTPDDTLAERIAAHSRKTNDPLWRLPLWKPYRKLLDSASADLSNDPDSAFGGAITAALYLQEFVSKTSAWVHIDMMAWNLSNRPGRPQGGEAMAIRALYSLIKEHYGS
ncbi:MAG: leucyl aminopeptidase family protein [Rickettsiales bacterium]|nr:leucyl aminopeptidase family protein [Rickettsiales bacterium]